MGECVKKTNILLVKLQVPLLYRSEKHIFSRSIIFTTVDIASPALLSWRWLPLGEMHVVCV